MANTAEGYVFKVCKEVTMAKERYLNSPLMMDTEYIEIYTKVHKELTSTSLRHPTELRAECHARALEGLTPTIMPGELLVGRKTRYTRGAIPYCNYAAQFILRELQKVQQEEQDSVTEVGTGGGIAEGKRIAETQSSEFATFGKKFLIKKTEFPVLQDCAKYWSGKCMQDVSDRLWKKMYPAADYIEKGWKAVMYTAAHDPAPEGRNILDFETALGKGLLAIAEDCEARARAQEVTTVDTADKIYFWLAVARVLRATIAWANNYAVEARKLAAEAKDPEDRERLLKIAERCEHCPAYPPRNFAEAMQSFWFIYLAGHLEGAYMGYSPGRFDSYMYPYFKNEFASGTLSKQTVVDLLAFLRVKMTEIEYVSSFAWEGLGSGNLFQNMILGGLTEDGLPADNELSILVVDAAIACKTIQPTLSVWYDERLSDAFLMKCAACVKTGVGFPAWFNFKCYAQHEMEASGLPLKVIRKYASMGGCTEPTLGGMSYGIVQAGFINLCKVLELALYGGKDPRTGVEFTKTPIPTNTEELIEIFEKQLQEVIRTWQRYWNYVMAAHKQTCVMVFQSALTRDCISVGKSLDEGGAINNATPTTLSSGMVNVVNSMAAVKTLVDDEKVCTLEELKKALLANWEGFASLKEQAVRAPKWGNDDDRADQFYVRLFDIYCNIVRRQNNYLGKPYDPSMLAISTHAPFGRACLATPDGRVCGETLADGVTSPFYGTDVSGPFSVLLSASKIDHTRIRGGLHNMKLHPGSVRGASGSRKLLNLIGTYFKSSSSFQIQFNVVDGATLRAAQENPKEYRDLIVRVAGFSAYFVELAKPIQDEVIGRTEHMLSASETSAIHEDEEVEDSTDGGIMSAIEGKIFDVQDFTTHDGPGTRTTVFLKGCPLRCTWCCNPEGQTFELNKDIEDSKLVGRVVTAGELVSQLSQRSRFYANGGGVTLSGGEPLAQPKFAHAIARLLVRHGIEVAFETSGFWTWDEVRPAIACASLVYFDIKAITPAVHKKATGVDNTIILNNLSHVVNQLSATRVVVSVPVIPGVNDNIQECSAIAAAVKIAGAKNVRLLPYHNLATPKYKAMCKEYEMGDEAKTPSMEVLESLRKVFTDAGVQCTIVHSL